MPYPDRHTIPGKRHPSLVVFVAFFLVLILSTVSRLLAVEVAGPLTLAEADTRLAIADRMIQGGIYDRAVTLAASVLDDPAADGRTGAETEILEWLKRREFARLLFDRGKLGMASTQSEILDSAASLVQLANNRYRLPDPAYNIQAAYWAGRAYEMAGEYDEAVIYYGRVGGYSLPPEMEGDAAQRMSRCLRLLSEAIPYPGDLRERQRRDRLLNQAIGELDRARLAFPVGPRRKEIELDLIALRLARRDEQYIREAITEAEAFIEGDPSKDELRARAVLQRGQASALLGQPDVAAAWFRRVVEDEHPADTERRQAELGLALSLMEIAEGSSGSDKNRLYAQGSQALERATAGTMSPGPWDGARILEARLQLELGQPTAALETLAPIVKAGKPIPAALHVAGMAEWRRGRLDDALSFFFPATRPSNGDRAIRYAARRDGARAADSARDYGLALALGHQASRMLRRDRLFSSLLISEFAATDGLLKLGKMGGPVSLSSDNDLLAAETDRHIASMEEMRNGSLVRLAETLGRLFAGGGDPDSAYDLAVHAEAAQQWSEDTLENLELAIAIISHLQRRNPGGITDNTLSSRLGQARHALALARAERLVLADTGPEEADIDKTLADFAAAADSFQQAAAEGVSVQDSLDQGMVNLESGSFLMRLAERWDRGNWSAPAARWRDEARRRVEASIRPFNHAIATSGPSGLASRRARWSRGRALELLGEWRGAAADFLSLMNNSELPRVVRANAARRWAVCMGEMGENRQALTRLSSFTDADAEAALLAGRIAEAAGLRREAYRYFLFAANPEAPSLPPYTADRVGEAAYNAARLAFANPREADPMQAPEAVIRDSRRLLENNILPDPGGKWTIPILNLLGESHLREPDGWRDAVALARRIIDLPQTEATVDRAMHILAARALIAGQAYSEALDELDQARELTDPGAASRVDAARVTLETARVYRLQERYDDALRAFTDVFAVYPDVEPAENAARLEAAEMLLTMPGTGQNEHERAVGILRGVRDQVEAEKLLREYGSR